MCYSNGRGQGFITAPSGLPHPVTSWKEMNCCFLRELDWLNGSITPFFLKPSTFLSFTSFLSLLADFRVFVSFNWELVQVKGQCWKNTQNIYFKSEKVKLYLCKWLDKRSGVEVLNVRKFKCSSFSNSTVQYVTSHHCQSSSLFAHYHLIEMQLKDALQGDKILKLKN